MLYPNQLNIITYKDTAPVMIEDKEGAIDRLGFKKARKKMDEAHNNMINTKYQLAIYTQFPSDLRADQREESGPLADVFDSSPRRHIPTQEDLQRAIDSPSYADPEYRKVAKEYLEKILPAVNAERDRLTEEIASAALKFRKSDAHTELQKEYMRSAAAARTMGATEARGNVNAEGIDFDGRKAAPKKSYFFKFLGK